MKKSQIILGASALVLAIVGAFTTKASHKNNPINVAWTDGFSCHVIGAAAHLTLLKSNHATARTSYPSGHTLRTAINCVKTAFTNVNN